jgi:REP element-mobilizing transposase RayT
VSSKTLRDEFFLHPTPSVNGIIRGVLAKGLQNWPAIGLHAYVFMSNHFHLILRGDALSIPGFVGFLKREISRRIGALKNLPGTIWHHRYTATALPSRRSQLRCLRYVLAHGAKEGLVESPQDWPGVHCLRQMLLVDDGRAKWFNRGAWSKSVFQAKARGKTLPAKAEFMDSLRIVLSPMPFWRRGNRIATRDKVQKLMSGIIETGIGQLAQRTIQRSIRMVPKPFDKNSKRKSFGRPIVAWASRGEPEVKAYLHRYWEFQIAYRKAASSLAQNVDSVPWPIGAWIAPHLKLGI